jgi:hypothetical protein
VSFAFYFDDPDGNMIEVYWPHRRPELQAALCRTPRFVEAGRGAA